ncbi:MAG: ribbon-helix-helix protein, CopG family, partial [Chloroflexota bacterium]
MISLPKPLLEVVDRAASEEHRSRSELFREAAR